MNTKDAAVAVAVFLLTACTPYGMTATPANTSDKEPAGMDTTPATPDKAAPRADASALLKGLLRLIEGSKDIGDFTPERLEAELGMPIKSLDDANWGGSELLTSDWRANVRVYPHPLNGQRTFVLDIGPEESESNPPMTAICSVDMERFGQQLTKQGMHHETMRGEHGMAQSERYTRQGLEVEVMGRQEADEPEALNRHQCVNMVVIN